MTSTAPTPETVVQFAGVSKRFGDVTAIDDISFEIRRGEFFSVLGPSGCGKTSALRVLAGFEEPDAGEVRLLGRVANRLRPYERPVGMVFQNYALFPHLNAGRNVSFGLERRKVPQAEIGERVRRALEMVRLPGFESRGVHQLSGGQRQRVALARALVLEPAILLLDEPLGAIDLKLRKEMQLELKQLNKQLNTTFIYVTHDQEEALTMSDRIAVMNGGRIEQLGSPAEIYEAPRSSFVASFIGLSNFFRGVVRGREGRWCSVQRQEGGTFLVPAADGLRDDSALTIAVRPEWLDVFLPDRVPAGENALPGVVRDLIYLGNTLHILITLESGQEVTVALRNEGTLGKPAVWRPGDRTAVTWLPEDCQLLEETA